MPGDHDVQGEAMSATAATIRPARSSDALAIAALARQLGYEAEPSAVAARLSRVLARPDQQFLVADVDGRPVGWIHLLVSEYVEADAFVTIGGLVVDRHHRKQGIGRRLLGRAEAWAAQQGCSVIRLSSSTSRSDAHAFYQHVGYTNIKTQYSFAKSTAAAGPEAFRAFVPNVT